MDDSDPFQYLVDNALVKVCPPIELYLVMVEVLLGQKVQPNNPALLFCSEMMHISMSFQQGDDPGSTSGTEQKRTGREWAGGGLCLFMLCIPNILFQ